MNLLQINPAAGPPDCFVLAADGVWCPTYEVRERVIDRVYASTWYAHHPAAGVQAVTPARIGELHAEGRVRATALHASPPAVPAAGPDSPRSRQLVSLPTYDRAVPLRERMRRLLNARCKSLEGLTGQDPDEMRHRAVGEATFWMTESSVDPRVTDDEMEYAVSFVEHELYEAGFDFEKADAEYFARRLVRIEGGRPAAPGRAAA
ncbi:MAG TPA: hypothetical protein VF576_05335 [Rubricoccaceae bacterium]|jgi:hypothetical protein